MEVYRFIVRPLQAHDPRSAGYLNTAHVLGLGIVTRLECQDLYFIEGQVSEDDLRRLAIELLSDPITQSVEWGRPFLRAEAGNIDPQDWIVEVALRPGVTDPVADQIVRAAGVLGIGGVERASTGFRFVIGGEALREADLHRLAKRLLANATIQRYALGELEAVFPHPAEASRRVEVIPLREMDDDGLFALSQDRRAALDLAEMLAIQAYYRASGRDATDVEFETIAQTWSEHCVHKTFKARITVEDRRSGNSQVIDGLLKTYLRSASEQIDAPWVRSAFVDNAGVIDFDDEHEVSFKVETHNHPSAIEPFGGANTGVGGVIRDVLGVSARPIAATDVLCFGPQNFPIDELPEGVLHPRRIQSGVVAGVQDYGNKIGIPTVNGAILYDPGYTANPLVFCGCVGIAPKGSHPRTPLPGDRVIVLGGGTGRDGLRGATFSSMTMDAQTGEVSGASVQIGDPITEKGLIEVILRARDGRLYHAVTDCGAGGLSSAVGEMAKTCGAVIDLDNVRLKYPGLAPWEIWLSEAQERMVLAVPESALGQLRDICATFDVQITDIGEFSDSGRLVVRYAGQVALDLDNRFLHEGIPQRQLKAIIQDPPVEWAYPSARPAQEMDANAILLALLAHPDIASKAHVIHLYDTEVQGGTLVKPLTGIQGEAPSDGCVLRPVGTQGRRGLALANGINPAYGRLDSYRMAVSAVDEALRNVVAVGADPQRAALLDNFCWGDPKRPETLGALVQAARGCYDAALHFGAPFISGKDSLNNEYLGSDGERHAIPPTLLISSMGIVEDAERAVTMDLKGPGNWLYLVGDFQPVWGGSHFEMCCRELEGGIFQSLMPNGPEWDVPGLSEHAPAVYRALHQAMQQGLVRACHDLSEGGLAVAAAEMCIGGKLGLALMLEGDNPFLALFGETNGCLLAEVHPEDGLRFEAFFPGLPCKRMGETSRVEALSVLSSTGANLIDLPVSHLVEAWSQRP